MSTQPCSFQAATPGTRKSLAWFPVLCLAVFSYAATPNSAYGQEWVQEMFKAKEHDFGIVPRGAKTEYEFEFENKYEQVVHVAGVRSSCGCTSPRVTKDSLKTYEKSSIVCEFNTRSFIGQKSAVVTVIFDRPSYGEMQLMVRGNIRSDIVSEPGEVQFGEVEPGQEVIKQVRVSYAGVGPWEITDVRSENKNLGVSFPPASRTRDGRVEYMMSVRLKDSAPTGEFADQIVLVTSDQNFNLVTIPVRGLVTPPLTVSAPLVVGTLKNGDVWSERIVVSAKVPFAVKEVKCNDSRFTFTPTTKGEQRLHIIQVNFAANEAVGAFREKITIETSLATDGIGGTFISGNVVE